MYALLLTARNAKEHIIAGLEAGADDYLIKPVHEPELIARLNTGRRILASSTRCALRTSATAFCRSPMRSPGPSTGATSWISCRASSSAADATRMPLSVIMCDIDHFKQVNDVRGHAAGDEVLQQFAARIQRSIRTTSDWLARLGGEEFLIVLPETDYEGAVPVAEKIRDIVVRRPS